jgi:hypothetical protein
MFQLTTENHASNLNCYRAGIAAICQSQNGAA